MRVVEVQIRMALEQDGLVIDRTTNQKHPKLARKRGHWKFKVLMMFQYRFKLQVDEKVNEKNILFTDQMLKYSCDRNSVGAYVGTYRSNSGTSQCKLNISG